MEYVNKCTLEFNGQSIESFSSFTENDTTLGKQVELMNTTGFADMTPRYGFTVDWKRPKGGWPFNPLNIKNGVVTVEYDDGTRVDFGGVKSLTTGDGTIDGETELTRTGTYGAVTRNPPLG